MVDWTRSGTRLSEISRTTVVTEKLKSKMFSVFQILQYAYLNIAKGPWTLWNLIYSDVIYSFIFVALQCEHGA